MSMKYPLTPAGIEPATFRIVAQHLNHCATAVPSGNLFPTFSAYRPHPQGQESRIPDPEDGTDRLKTSVTNYHYSLLNNPVERSSVI